MRHSEHGKPVDFPGRRAFWQPTLRRVAEWTISIRPSSPCCGTIAGGRSRNWRAAEGLKVSRATVRARIDRLERAGEIIGYTVVLRADAQPAAVRAITLVAVEGRRPAT